MVAVPDPPSGPRRPVRHPSALIGWHAEASDWHRRRVRRPAPAPGGATKPGSGRGRALGAFAPAPRAGAHPESVRLVGGQLVQRFDVDSLDRAAGARSRPVGNGLGAGLLSLADLPGHLGQPG